MAPRTRKPKGTTTETQPTISLIPALEFASCVIDDKVTEVRISHGWLCATNGVVTVGHPVSEELDCAVRAATLLAALRRCKEAYSLTQSAAAVSVKSGSFSASAPATDPVLYAPCVPDDPCGPFSDDVRKALAIVEPFTAESEPRVVCSSVLLQGNSCVATDGIALAEAWHGYHLPPDIVLPKKGVQLLCKVARPATSFGFSEGSLTVYFEGGAWLKLQRYQTKYADYGRLFPEHVIPRELPPKLFETVKALQDFDDAFRMTPEGLAAEDGSAAFELPDMPEPQGYDGKRFLRFEPYVTSADFAQPEKAVLFGDKFRGMIMGRRA